MRLAIVFGLVPFAVAIPTPHLAPEPTMHAATAAVEAPEPTIPPEFVRRDVLNDASSYVEGLISDVKGSVTSFLNSGILDFPNGFPTGTAVKSSLGISDDDLDAQPTQVLNIP